MNKKFIEKLTKELDSNNGKISPVFVNEMAESAEKIFLRPTPNMRLCVLILPTGHEVIGVAQVLEEWNDVEETGNKVAYDNAVNELWKTFGSIAKVL